MARLGLKQLHLSKSTFAVLVVVAGVCAAAALLSYIAAIPLIQASTAVGSLCTAVGVLLALLNLRNAHEWNRRHYTIEFMKAWNESARDHLAALEREFPEFFAVPDFIKNPELRKTWCVNRARAQEMVKTGPSTPGHDAREHLITLLNYFEQVATAYEQFVVDRMAIADSFAPVILDVVTYFQPFIEEMRKIDRRDPWPPLSRVVELWLTEATRRRTQEDAEEASRRYKEALRKASEKLKEPTGA